MKVSPVVSQEGALEFPLQAPQRGLRVTKDTYDRDRVRSRYYGLGGADPALRQKAHVKARAVIPSIDVKGGLKGPLRDAELRPKIGYRQVPALQKEPGHAKSPIAKTVDYLLFARHGSSSRPWQGLPGRPLPYPFPRPPMTTFRPADGRGRGARSKGKLPGLGAARQARPATGASSK